MAVDRDKARDRRLKKLYGITSTQYDEMLGRQGGVCAICGRPPVNNRLAVDHDHKPRYFKVHTQKREDKWYATLAFLSGGVFYKVDDSGNIVPCGPPDLPTFSNRTRNGAIHELRYWLKRESVRGLLCFSCNSGLRKYSDDPQRLNNAAEYLRSHQAKFPWSPNSIEMSGIRTKEANGS